MTATAAALAALPASLLTIWALLRTPVARHVVAAPRADRWHTKSTPLLGGCGFMAGVLAAAGIAVAFGVIPASRELGGILLGSVIIFVAGLLDDVYHLSPIAKIGAQLAAAAIVIASGVRVEIVSNNTLGTVIGLVWLVGMTNAFNLLDNMDGLAATLAAIACAFFALDAFTEHPSNLVAVLALGTCFACLGFLPYNLRLRGTAAVFMGDSGSQLLGFLLAALGLAASWNVAGSTVATLLLPILVLGVPILDTTLVTIVRLLEGRPITQGGRDHTSHRLVYEGLSDKRAVVLLATVSAGLGLTSLAYNVLDDTRITLIGVLLTFAFLLQFGSYLADVNRGPYADRAPSFLRSLLVHRRRLIEVLVDFALITASFTLAFVIRLEGTGYSFQRHVFDLALPALLVSRYIAFIAFGLYRGVWRYAGARDAVSVFACGARVRGSDLPLRVGNGSVERLPAGDVPDRPASLHDARRRVALLGTRSGTRVRRARRAQRAAPRPDRRSGPKRPEPSARAPRDTRRARRRVRGRRSGAAAPADPGCSRRRRSGRDRLGAWAHDPRLGARDRAGRPARAPRRRDRGLRPGRCPMPIRAPRDRSRP